jgi:HEAT repeat protein
MAHRGAITSERYSAATPLERYATEDPPPWLAELLHAPDPSVRIQALDAWARHPGASLDPVTYALVDQDQSVRERAQEVLEEALARR